MLSFIDSFYIFVQMFSCFLDTEGKSINSSCSNDVVNFVYKLNELLQLLSQPFSKPATHKMKQILFILKVLAAAASKAPNFDKIVYIMERV